MRGEPAAGLRAALRGEELGEVRAALLDAALLRPGRFDRRVSVDLPDREGREQILHVHAKDTPLHRDVDLASVAKRTIGFSGASLANLMNEAAIVAARRDKTEISYDEIDYSIDRVTVGMQKTTGTSFPARQRLVAYHEAGHAIMGALTPDYDTLTKVTIPWSCQIVTTQNHILRWDSNRLTICGMKNIVAGQHQHSSLHLRL